MSDMNDKLPSAADSLGKDASSTSRVVQDAIAATEQLAADMARRSSQAYRSGNASFAAHVDPLPAMLVAAAAGFVAGYLWSAASER